MQLAAVVKKQKELEEELRLLTADYGQKKARLEQEIRECDRLRANMANGVDLAKLQLAESVIEIYGKLVGTERLRVIEDAISSLAHGGERLYSEYFGVKNYAAFGDQREDHRYGYCPRHGYIVFSVGIKEARRSRIRNGEPLTPEELEACIYYLENVKRGNVVRREQA